MKSDAPVILIEPGYGRLIPKLKELVEYRDLFYFLVRRDIKSRYAQSVLGTGWAIIQPLVQMVVFSVVFGTLAKISSDGVPYAIFSYAALVPWTYFSGTVIAASNSLVGSASMLTKVYFPRLIIPLSPVLHKLVDFFIALLILFGLMGWFRMAPTLWALALPLLVVLMMAAAAGIGMVLSVLSVQYRDVNHALTFMVHLMMFATPVIYSVNEVPERFRLLFALNPMVGVIEGFRSALLHTNQMPWDLIAVGAISTALLLTIGAYYFCRLERIFADVV